MHAVDFADAEAVHHAVIDHGLAAGAALLGRLKNDHRAAVEIARLGEIARGARAAWRCARHGPQACNFPGTVDLYGRPVASSIGNASMSARKPIVLVDLPLRPG